MELEVPIFYKGKRVSRPELVYPIVERIKIFGSGGSISYGLQPHSDRVVKMRELETVQVFVGSQINNAQELQKLHITWRAESVPNSLPSGDVKLGDGRVLKVIPVEFTFMRRWETSDKLHVMAQFSETDGKLASLKVFLGYNVDSRTRPLPTKSEINLVKVAFFGNLPVEVTSDLKHNPNGYWLNEGGVQ